MYIENIDGLYSYALIVTRNHAEAEDLVQETYLRALKAMGRLRAGSNMKAWLFTILRNVWLNQLRKRRNGPQMIQIGVGDAAGNIAEPSKDAHDLYVSKMEAEQVRTAIQKLSLNFREVILLREYEELSYQEIADVLQCPVGTVMSRLGRARAKLRALLAGNIDRVRLVASESARSSRNPGNKNHRQPIYLATTEQRSSFFVQAGQAVSQFRIQTTPPGVRIQSSIDAASM
jgi:RNA polymerase sigma-70 factor (ECF subfamily)